MGRPGDGPDGAAEREAEGEGEGGRERAGGEGEGETAGLTEPINRGGERRGWMGGGGEEQHINTWHCAHAA